MKTPGRDFDISPSVSRAAVGTVGVAQAFKRALVSQCHPNMLLAVLLPFAIALVGAMLLLWFFWTPLTGWLDVQASEWRFINDTDAWLVGIGLFSLKLYLVPLAAMAILLPISGILGLAISAVFVMPLVIGHVSEREYAGLARRGRHATAYSVWNAVWVTAVFGCGWLLTLPFWLIPPMGIILSIFWWAFAFSRMMRVDAIVEHASPEERRFLLQRSNNGFWAIGLVCAVLNLFPPAWIILPVYAGLVNAHYGLEALRRLRQEPINEVSV